MVQKKISITLSQACEGMLLNKQAEGRSVHTINDYRNSFQKLALFFSSDPPIDTITRSDLVKFFAWLQQDYESEPDGVAPRGKFKLSQKTIFNIHIGLSSLWQWALVEKLVKTNILREIKVTRPSAPVINPISHEEWVRLVRACEASHNWKTREETKTLRITFDRDRAVLFTLLDTGARASELCGIRFQDLSLANRTIKLRGKGPGKEPKERLVSIGKATADAINKALRPRLAQIQPTSPLFVVKNKYDDELSFTRDNLGNLLERIGDRAGVSGVYPHRFRHTFAINYLRNGGNVFALQAMLGHTTLDMVKRYLQIAQIDLDREQQRASPVDNWIRAR
jgi:integrase/recombinase XerD